MPKTFAQYLIDKALPKGMHISKPVDNKYLADLLKQVYHDHNSEYSRVVTDLKRLGDKFSTLDGGMSFGVKELDTPNRAKRDIIIRKAQKDLDAAKTEQAKMAVLEKLQKDLADNDLSIGNDAASLMIRGALGGKKGQLMKLRTGPGVVKGADGNIVPEIFTKSYAEGVDPLHFWLGATEARQNLAQGQVSTSAPGELNKVIANVLNSGVVAKDDCGTKRGILLEAKSSDILDRYLARDEGKFKRNSLVTPEVQRELSKQFDKVLVRSPQTCESTGITVCVKCMGLRPSDGKKYSIGDNAGLIATGALSEPLTQMSLSAKHSTSMAKQVDNSRLEGEKGFRKLVEMPKTYSNRKVLAEVYGVVTQIVPAPQGGNIITVRETQKVPDRYIVNALPNKLMKQHWDYYVPPQLHLTVKKGAEVFPGFALSDGIDNLQDVARLRNLGGVRTAAAQNMSDVYKNTGAHLDRRHFELLARAAHNYVKIEEAPEGFHYKRGEAVEYNKFADAVKDFGGKEDNVSSKLLGKHLAVGVLHFTAGTEISGEVLNELKSGGVKRVKVIEGLSVSPVTTPLTRVVNHSNDWLSTLNHRYLKQAIQEAATLGKASDIHGYNPITAYAYGAEMGHHEDGKY